MKLLSYTTLFTLILFLASPKLLKAQTSKTPNYVLRNADFVDRRLDEKPINFAKEYYDAYKQRASNSLTKKSSEWTPIGPFGEEQLAGMGRVNSMQFHPTDTNTWFICVAQGGLWKTTNAGESWTSISSNLPILRTSYLSISPSDPNVMYVALGDFAYLGHNLQANENKRNSHYGLGVYKTTNAGASWSPTGLSFDQTSFEGSLIAKVLIHPTNHDRLIAVGQTGAYTSNNGGSSWTQTSQLLFWDLEQDIEYDSVLFATSGYVSSYDYGEAGILKSTDFGSTWTKINTAIPKTTDAQRIEIAQAPSDPTRIYAIVCDDIGGLYGFYKSTDKGETFTLEYDHENNINLLNSSLTDAPGGQGRYDLAIVVDKTDKENVLIAGINIWRTLDAGLTFSPVSYWSLNYQNLSVHADVHELRQHPTNSSYFVSHDGGLSRTFEVKQDSVRKLKVDRESQTEFIDYTSGLNITLFYRLSINPDEPENKIAGAQDNSTVFTDGSRFFNLSGGDGMESVFANTIGYTYTSSQNGRIYVYSNTGSSFSYEGQFFPPNQESAEWTTPMSTDGLFLFAGYENVYGYTSNFLLDQYSDFSSEHPITALDVEKANPLTMYVAKRGYNSSDIDNQIFTTSNGGDSWQDISSGLPRRLYPAYVTMNQSDPSEAWIVFSGFNENDKIFTTTDNGENWTNITHNLPNIPVNCITHQNDESNYVYIGTDLGVYYKEKDSTNWIEYNQGLPPVIVSELEIDTTNKSLVAATFGRGMWQVDLVPYEGDSGINVNEINREIQINIAPNPVADDLGILVQTSNIYNQFNAEILDITGRTVYSKKGMFFNNQKQHVNVSELKSGEYFLILKHPELNGRLVKRFIKN